MSAGLMTMKKQRSGLRKSAPKQLSTKKPVRKPHNYQRRGVEWLVTHGGAGLFAAPGAGKTAVTLRAFLALKDAKVARRALVVATLRVAYKVWPTEAANWAGSEWARIQELKVCVLHGPKKDFKLNEDADIFVVNFDGLKWLLQDHAKEFKALEIDTLVIDESTKIKHTRTKRFKLLKPYLTKFKRRWILTGKPIPRSYLDLFGQIYVIDMGYALGVYVTHFRANYFSPLDLMGWSWALKEGAQERIQERIAPYIFQLQPGDYKEIPIVENVIRVDLPDDARKLYDEMEEELLVQLDKHTVTAANSGVVAGKCAQIANGGLYHNDDHIGERTWTDIHDVKVEAVSEIVEELQGSPALVVYEYKHDLFRLKKMFPDAPYSGGKVPRLKGYAAMDKNDDTEDRWNRDEIPVWLVNAQSMAHGLNLQYGTAYNIIWHSITYDRELYDQLNMRLARQGQQASSIFSHFIVAMGTVDQPKMATLKRKGKVQNDFLDALKQYAKEKKLK